MLPGAVVPPQKEIEEIKLGEQVADGIVAALTQEFPSSPSHPGVLKEEKEVCVFSGKDYVECMENMEKYFLQNRWSDGLPLVPPTEEAVNRMLEGTELPRHHVVGLVEPVPAEATVEKIAINAVMAGCLPQYMPVIIAAVEAITDPMFDLRGVQCTAGLVSPFLIVSGQKLIEELNINDSFSTIGPGWRANATIGRAIRLMMINIGHMWPGEPDMKSFGSPFKYVTLMAENEAAYMGAWEPMRVTEGFNYDQPTISVMPAVSWQPELVRPETATTEKSVELISKQARVKYDRDAITWGMDNLVIISPAVLDVFRREQRSRIDIQKAIYEASRLPCSEFFGGKEPSAEVGVKPKPEWLIEKCKVDPGALVPLFLKPESIKICVAGAPGPGMVAYISTWGFGPAHFVTKAIKPPQNWENLLEKYKGWESPIVR
ncbi:hypothetical protein ACFLUZ_06875 [Chloroflexota bacterium]